jgi:hypothetical protein
MQNLPGGTGLQGHDLIERRLALLFEMSTHQMKTIAVTFTNAWWAEISCGLGAQLVNRQSVRDAAMRISGIIPEILTIG